MMNQPQSKHSRLLGLRGAQEHEHVEQSPKEKADRRGSLLEVFSSGSGSWRTRATRLCSTLIVGCCVLGVLLVPIGAHADTEKIRNVKVTIDEKGAHLKLVTNRALGKYKVHARRRQMRIWFAHTSVARHFIRQGDGRWIKSVHVRPGVSNTAVVQLRFGRKMPFDPEKLGVSIEAGETRIRLARDKSSLPPQSSREKQLSKAKKASSSTSSSKESKVGGLILPKADGKGFEASDTGEDSGDGKLIRAKTDEQSKKEDEGFDFLSDKKNKKDEKSGSFGMEKNPGMGSVSNILLLLLLLGGGIYMGIKRFFPSSKKTGSSDIEVVASRHIGPRTQLMVVRALGSDHLLSIHAGKTERFAFTPSQNEQRQNSLRHSSPSLEAQAHRISRKPARVPSFPPRSESKETDPKEVLKSMRKGWRLFSGMQPRDPYDDIGKREETRGYSIPSPSMQPGASHQPAPSYAGSPPTFRPDLRHSSSGMLPLGQERAVQLGQERAALQESEMGNLEKLEGQPKEGDWPTQRDWLQQKPNKHRTVRFDFLRGSEEAPDFDDEETRKAMQQSDFGQQVIRSATTPYLGRESDGSVFATPESVHGLLRLQERVKDSNPVPGSAYPSRYPSAAER